MTRKAMVGLLALALAAPAALAGPSDLWLHVKVEETGPRPETVRVNVPFSLVEAVLPLIEHEHLRHGRVKLTDELEVEGIDLRGIWEAVRETEDGEYVTVEAPDEKVRVAKSKGYLLVEVEEDDGEEVNVKIPLDVVDALFSGKGDELNVIAAIKALRKHSHEDLVTVSDGDSKVRIWIDDRQEAR